ncbi:MAG: leucine--tRNA ligase, partial [Promethearchaeota archaeon]
MIDFKDIEPKWQMRWREAQAFQADPNPQRPKFYITSPYPYANAPLHIGHGRPYTVTDILARYKRMRGFNVLWPMAAHVTGTPVFGVARRIQDKDKEILKEYRTHIRLYRPKKEVEPILRTFTDPMAIAQFFSGNIERDFRKVGYSVDWRRKFTTNDPEYHAFVTWQFYKLNERGYITKGSYPILYCPSCNNAVGEDDLLEGEHAKISEFVAIKFPFNDGYLVAATLRPETVYGLTNIWVNPKSTMVKIKVGKEYWYLAKPALDKLRRQGHKVIHVAEIPGRKFIGKTCTSPVEERDVLILPAEFVDAENATGVVYSVPSHAPFDWAALRDLQGDDKRIRSYNLGTYATTSIHPISIIAVEGYGEHPAVEIVEKMKITSQEEAEKLEEATEILYKAEFYGGIMKDNCGPFAGRRVNEIKDDVIAYLEEQNRAFRFYQPDRKPVICRCGTDVLVAVLPDQWFINYGDPEWKAQATYALEKMTIFPESYRRLFETTFEWLKERPCARRRGLGTPLPFDKRWIIESLSDSTIYMSFYLIIHHLREHRIKPEQLTQAFFDFVLLGEGEI